MGAPLPASPSITPFAKCTCFVQLENKNGDKKIRLHMKQATFLSRQAIQAYSM
jgi:hypothetical protein